MRQVGFLEGERGQDGRDHHDANARALPGAVVTRSCNVLALGVCVRYSSSMIGARARRWLAICGVILAGCGSDAAGPRTPVAPVAATPAPAALVAPPPAPDRAVEPPSAAAPAPEPSPPPEPAVALPPCPTDPRDREQMPDQVVQLLALSDGMTVVDLGSGDGYFLCRLSRAVGGHGRVIATEIDKQLVRELNKRIAREHLANAEVVLAPTSDVGIAPGTADRILLVKVWHHLSDRDHYAARIARALAPGGKVVVVDFRPGGRHGPGHGIVPERVLAELRAGGIDGALVPEDLPDQYIIIGTVRTRGASHTSRRARTEALASSAELGLPTGNVSPTTRGPML